MRKEKHLDKEEEEEGDEEVIYKIEVPANRYPSIQYNFNRKISFASIGELHFTIWNLLCNINKILTMQSPYYLSC